MTADYCEVLSSEACVPTVTCNGELITVGLHDLILIDRAPRSPRINSYLYPSFERNIKIMRMESD